MRRKMSLSEAKESGGWLGVQQEIDRRMSRLGYSERECDLRDQLAEFRVVVAAEVDRLHAKAERAAEDIDRLLEESP